MACALDKIDVWRLDVASWPTVNEEQLPEDERVLFVQRQRSPELTHPCSAKLTHLLAA